MLPSLRNLTKRQEKVRLELLKDVACLFESTPQNAISTTTCFPSQNQFKLGEQGILDIAVEVRTNT